jgi:predicted transcriptional regulator
MGKAKNGALISLLLAMMAGYTLIHNQKNKQRYNRRKPTLSSFIFLKITCKEIKKLSLERIFKALVSLGLSKHDARVYVYLALKGPTKAGSIVDNLRMSRSQIHRSLKHLQDKGVVFADSKSRGVFSALLFEEALKLLIETEKTKTQILQETKEALLSDFKIAIKKNSTDS